MSEPKSMTKKFRLSERDARLLAAHAEAAEVNESEYIRALVTDPGHVFTAERDTLRSIYRELKRQGVNINQIARSANASKGSPFDARALASLAESNREMVLLLTEALGGRRR